MSPHPGLEFAAKTDTGRVRAQNEDSIATSPRYRFAVLADGMGGYNAGEVASQIAVSSVTAFLEERLEQLQHHRLPAFLQRPRQLHRLLAESIALANDQILAAAQAQPQYQGMGTTIVAVVFKDDKAVIAHVGDSRAYSVRQSGISQLTRDHSLLQEQIDAGIISEEAARTSQYKNLLTKALGVGADVEIDVREHRIEPGDTVMLCSDGLSDLLTAEEILGIVQQHRASLDAACTELIAAANAHGGYDNISVVLVKRQPAPTGDKSRLQEILRWIRLRA